MSEPLIRSLAADRQARLSVLLGCLLQLGQQAAGHVCLSVCNMLLYLTPFEPSNRCEGEGGGEVQTLHYLSGGINTALYYVLLQV